MAQKQGDKVSKLEGLRGGEKSHGKEDSSHRRTISSSASPRLLLPPPPLAPARGRGRDPKGFFFRLKTVKRFMATPFFRPPTLIQISCCEISPRFLGTLGPLAAPPSRAFLALPAVALPFFLDAAVKWVRGRGSRRVSDFLGH